MLKKHMATCLVVTAFAAAPALAQTQPSAPTDRPTASGSGATTSGSPAMQPGATGSSPMTAPSAGSSAMNQSGSQGQFMTQIQPTQVMASDLIGTRVVSTNNESIGDINDVIVDRNGQVMAVVVGVGGFLGIGEKDVAVPFKSLEFANSQQANAMDNNSAGSGNVATTGSTTTGNQPGQGNTGGMSNSNMATNNAAAGSGNGASANEPDRVILRMTKAELQAAPAFKAEGNNGGGSTTGTTGAGGATPQQ
ncbi:PRC-barrel domain-containing protein [Microvirga pakistanensis]|uniref:PRC-barrel domain-containing protein n=1 Tax=Microvirga pakistanensis TaxID=1682650 RepID=UPI00141AE179|nr:PRC-barrel domain-containing protein [Microvirga pakistanensis]